MKTKLPTCPTCNANAIVKTGAEVYPRRPDLSEVIIYACPNHPDTYVGSHKDGTPLGVMADREHRNLKMQAHAAFDPIWKSTLIPRQNLYSKLSKELNIPKEQTHIGMFSKEQCLNVVQIVNKWKNQWENL